MAIGTLVRTPLGEGIVVAWFPCGFYTIRLESCCRHVTLHESQIWG